MFVVLFQEMIEDVLTRKGRESGSQLSSKIMLLIVAGLFFVLCPKCRKQSRFTEDAIAASDGVKIIGIHSGQLNVLMVLGIRKRTVRLDVCNLPMERCGNAQI